jgi:peptidoglycan-associated lipoprotein
MVHIDPERGNAIPITSLLLHEVDMIDRAQMVAVTAAGFVAVSGMLGCSRRKAAPAAVPASAATDPSVAERMRVDSIARADADRRATEERERAAREARLDRERLDRERLMRELWSMLQTPIYFEFDRSDLGVDARAALDTKLSAMSTRSELRIRVNGHADARGSDEYNLALAMRRAAAAKRYLTQRGVEEGRIEIVSHGEERPVCMDPGEACWSRNRRAAFDVTAPALVAASP